MTGDPEALSEREKETLRLLLQGHDAKSIARDLGLSVHTVNERLRSSRRKLEVPSSRQAARLLALSEQQTSNFVVNKQIGVARDGVEVNEEGRRNGRRGVKHPVVLAIGGTLAVSLILATAMLTWVSSKGTEPGPLPNWNIAARGVGRYARATNGVRLEGNRLLWNGAETSEATVRQYLGITKQMSPQPLLVLSYSAQASPERVQRVRLLVDEVLQCKPDRCLEITPSAK